LVFAGAWEEPDLHVLWVNAHAMLDKTAPYVLYVYDLPSTPVHLWGQTLNASELCREVGLDRRTHAAKRLRLAATSRIGGFWFVAGTTVYQVCAALHMHVPLQL
jgi:hypothetical protein